MSQSLAAFTPIKFAMETIKLLYNESLLPKITNTKYEGTLKQAGDRVRVRMSHKIIFSPYTKVMPIEAQELNPTYEDLVIDQAQYFKIEVDDIDKVQNDINAISEYAANAKRDAAEMLDTDVLSYMRKNVGQSAKTVATSVETSNAIGTSYATGTVAVADGTGVVTGSNTVFTAGMVGGYFKAVGHTKYYLVTEFDSTTQITIKDLDGVAYTGGAISAGAAYSINAATPITITNSNIYATIVKIKTALDKALCPSSDRFLLTNADMEGVLLNAPEFIPAVGAAYEDAVKGGKIGSIAGFSVHRSELIDGNSTTGFWYVAGTKDFCSFATQISETSVIPSASNPNQFVDILKGLVVWGRKVFGGTRAYGAVLRAKV